MATKSSVQDLAALYQTPGERLAALRKERGCTQGDLAELLNTTKAAISRYESNLIDIPRTKIQKLAEYFMVTPAFLMGWANKRDSSDLFLSHSSDQVFPPEKKAPYPGLRPDYTTPKPEASVDRQEKELLSIFRKLSMRGQTKLLSMAYELQDSEQPLSFENLTGPKPFSTAEELAAFIRQITSEPEKEKK